MVWIRSPNQGPNYARPRLNSVEQKTNDNVLVRSDNTSNISIEYLRKWKTEVRSWPSWRCYQWHSEFEVHRIRTYNYSVKTVWRCRDLEIWSWSLKTVSIGRKFNEHYQRGRFDIYCNVNVFDQRSDTETANLSARWSNNTLVWLFFLSFLRYIYIYLF